MHAAAPDFHPAPQTDAPDFEALRADFPILHQNVNGHPLIYFDNAATSQKPRQVIEALVHYYEHDNSNVHRGIHALSNRATAGYEAARVRAAKFLNAPSANEIVFVNGTTDGINLVAATWGRKFLKAGDEILLLELEHHSNIVPWQLLAASSGVKLKYVPVEGDSGTVDLAKLDALLTPSVKLFVFPHISNTMGVINPAKEFIARAKAIGAKTLVDAAQSAGHLVVDVQDLGCDFLVFSGHKILGPTGTGVLYGRAELLDAMPPYQGGGEMISSVDFFSAKWNTIPHKFEAGTPHIAGAFGLHAAMDYLDRVGRDRIFAHDQDLAVHAYRGLKALDGIRIFGPGEDRAGLVSFVLGEAHSHDVVTLADQKGIALRGGHHCNQPLHKKLGIKSSARASFYFYNTRAEVDRFLEVVAEIQHFFRRGTG